MDAEIGVIGAGAAGLEAARRLRAAGRETILLEARGRIGGRLWTLHPEGWPAAVELGAEFIHGNPVELRGLEAESAGEREDWSEIEGKLQPAGEFAGGAGRVFAAMAAHRPPRADCSFTALLATVPGVTAAARAGALGFIEGFEAADPAEISVFALNRERAAEEADTTEESGHEGVDEGPRRPRGGFDALLRQLDPGGSVELGAVVEQIVWRRGEVCIRARQNGGERTWRVRQALITLPLGVLQRNPDLFEPRLEAKRAALAGLVMGGALRVTLRLRRAVWEGVTDDTGRRMERLGFLFGRAGESGHFPTWWVAPGAEQITGWAAGRHAWALAGWPAERVIGRALDDLAARLRLPRRELEAGLLEAHTHDWQSDPWARGAYSYIRAGAVDAPAALAAPLEETLHFAGEATDNSGRHATVHGALRSGARAAAEILAGG